ncbi:7-carboxy-7-deazaguanine synthase QueE [Psychrobacter sanguinis]|uniref:7-carboxy-7-deazaguanine synthase QueE n=1 Tax=Psychrobacter sanguinis TaxID=861445 RepID=UPI00191B2CD4|nr:7-carboxy-7-deazaguanine synthase QueE [Psychrobacter sanguinis]MCC3308093.1 7-carboxy-7-deazaguanine synthase QueE [Psychrobacter sanguinis]MCC3344158.1 7-carboxy-7-deazaguanine synthase QueE [Psychrobacter sanguinis]UEC25375.1 7-carboxy-7-deazaguanine synthase QueE [Psychrobacter sanguinis]
MTQATPLRSQSIPVTDPEAGLRMTEIFYSLQGEALTSGLPTVFVRLTGCPLRCVYCDTTYSFTGGERLSLEAIMADIAQYPCKRVCITGGEPLAQPNCIALINRLLEAGYEISLETAGALSVADVPEAVSKVMDVKTPSSGESDKNLWSNLDYLTQHDQLKFVIMNRSDYEWSKQQLIDYKLDQKVGTVWFSPMFNVHDNKDSAVEVPNLARELAEWILEDAIPVRLQLQLHKIIWADAKGK